MSNISLTLAISLDHLHLTLLCFLQIAAFGDILRDAGFVCTVRERRGDDEMAACGQLGHVEAIESMMPLLDPPAQFADALVPA